MSSTMLNSSRFTIENCPSTSCLPIEAHEHDFKPTKEKIEIAIELPFGGGIGAGEEIEVFEDARDGLQEAEGAGFDGLEVELLYGFIRSHPN